MQKGADTMDIAALSTGLAQVNLQNAVGYAMLGKSIDNLEQSGNGITELLSSASQAMELSVNPHIGGNFDMSV